MQIKIIAIECMTVQSITRFVTQSAENTHSLHIIFIRSDKNIHKSHDNEVVQQSQRKPVFSNLQNSKIAHTWLYSNNTSKVKGKTLGKTLAISHFFGLVRKMSTLQHTQVWFSGTLTCKHGQTSELEQECAECLRRIWSTEQKTSKS